MVVATAAAAEAAAEDATAGKAEPVIMRVLRGQPPSAVQPRSGLGFVSALRRLAHPCKLFLSHCACSLAG